MEQHTTKIARERGAWFHVMNEGEPLPPSFAVLPAQDGLDRSIVRIAGGCKGLSQEMQDGLATFFVDAFRTVDAAGATTGEFKGTVFSGGTANFDDDGNLKGLMVTNIPGFLAEAYPCLAISTTPRTATMSLHPQRGAVIVDNYGGMLDHRQHANVVVQADAANVLGWDGDLKIYLNWLKALKDAGFKVAVIVMNGGDVTRDEIYEALKRGIPVIVVEGSLREADAFVKAFRDGNFTDTAGEMRAKLKGKSQSEAPADAIVEACKEAMAAIDRSLVTIVKLGDVGQMRAALIARGMLTEPAATTPADTKAAETGDTAGDTTKK